MGENLLNRGLHILDEEGIVVFSKKVLKYLMNTDRIHPVNNFIFDLIYRDRIDIIEQDWDNLILMDACRHDYFKDTISKKDMLNGNLKAVISQGGYSWEFMKNNFGGRELHDTIYITANPYAERLDEDTFYKIQPLYSTHWDKQWETVLPEDVVKSTMKTREEYPNKRIIVHFMQPHTPFIGKKAEELNERFNIRGFDRTVGCNDVEDMRQGVHIRDLVQDGKISKSAYHEAYTESLKIVLKNISELVVELDGRTVISSDHGELLGERVPADLWKKNHGHPRNMKTKTVYKVPWLEIESEDRRQTTTERPIDSEKVDQTTVEERLEALGYK